MSIDHAAPYGGCHLVEQVDVSVHTPPILLETRWLRFLLDVLGTVTLFASTALALDIASAILVTALVGAVVVTSRTIRWFRSAQ